MRTLIGLPSFFHYMNGHYAHWVLVGGAAAWMHLARADRDMTQDPGVYNLIFPEDIDVLIAGEPVEAPVEVQIGTRPVVPVQFANAYQDASIEELSEHSVRISGARVLPIGMIIMQYGKTGSAAAEKIPKRMTRVYMLKELQAGRQISPDLAMQTYKSPPEFGGIVGNPQARLRNTKTEGSNKHKYW